MKVALIRHGLTDWNKAGRVQGSVERDLCAEGRAILTELKPPAEFDDAPAYVSPQARARQTAELLGIQNPTIDERIREQNWGDWEGLTRPEMRLRPEHAAAGKGMTFCPPHGEANTHLLARVKDFLTDIASKHDRAVAVAHMGVLRAGYALATGWDMDGMPDALDLKAALVLDVQDGKISLIGCVPLPKKP